MRVIHCPTLELWQAVNAKLDWDLSDDNWDEYQEDSCIEEDDECYADKPYFEREGYEIISAEEFLNIDSSPQIFN